MRMNSMIFPATLMLASALTLSGCKKSEPAAPAAPGSTAGTSAAPAAPQGQPGSLAAVPASTPATAPAAPAVAPAAASAPKPAERSAPAAPAPARLTAPAGTRVQVTITETLSASRNNVGDGFSGVLSAPVQTAGGAVVFPRGANVTGSVVAAKGRGRFKGAGDLGIQVASINGVAVSTSVYERAAKGKGKRSAAMIGGGTGLGAVIGGLAGGGKGAAIGALAGAGAGTAGAAYTGNKDVVIPSESVVTFRLTAPVTVTKK